MKKVVRTDNKGQSLIGAANVKIIVGGIIFGIFSSLILLNSLNLIKSTENSSSGEQYYHTSKNGIDGIRGVKTNYHHVNDMRIHTTRAEALPSAQLSDEEAKEVNAKRQIYGGVNDKAHLGGFTDLDLDGVSPLTWKWMVETIGVKSIIDLGCGKGVSSLWFHLQGVDTLCAEGSHDAVQQSLLPPETVVEHDFTRGPWWPDTTYDAVWCVEFSEHVQRQYVRNYMPVFRKAALIFVTHSTWGGWHHAEVHRDDWWINKYTAMSGLIYSPALTEKIREKAREDAGPLPVAVNNDKTNYLPAHIRRTTLAFINPAVAGLDKHEHLFAEPGCFTDYGKPNFPCGEKTLPNGRPNKDIVTSVPDRFLPLKVQKENEKQWEEKVFASFLKEANKKNTTNTTQEKKDNKKERIRH